MKIRVSTNHLLGACVALLMLLCAATLAAPFRFEHEREQREHDVEQALVKIRHAQRAYRAFHGVYAPSLDSLVAAGLMSTKDCLIPHSQSKPFQMSTAVATGEQGSTMRLVECSAGYADYLDGLDADRIDQLTRQANDAGQYAGLKIGDLTTDNNNAGNWE